MTGIVFIGAASPRRESPELRLELHKSCGCPGSPGPLELNHHVYTPASEQGAANGSTQRSMTAKPAKGHARKYRTLLAVATAR